MTTPINIQSIAPRLVFRSLMTVLNLKIFSDWRFEDRVFKIRRSDDRICMYFVADICFLRLLIWRHNLLNLKTQNHFFFICYPCVNIFIIVHYKKIKQKWIVRQSSDDWPMLMENFNAKNSIFASFRRSADIANQAIRWHKSFPTVSVGENTLHRMPDWWTVLLY